MHMPAFHFAEGFLCCSELPPASTLFTDSEASSEAEEDKAALHSPLQARSAVLSCSTGRRADVPANKEPLQPHNGVEPKQPPLAVAQCSDNQVWLFPTGQLCGLLYLAFVV